MNAATNTNTNSNSHTRTQTQKQPALAAMSGAPQARLGNSNQPRKQHSAPQPDPALAAAGSQVINPRFRFEKLEVWQLARKLTTAIHGAVGTSRDPGLSWLSSQLLRAASDIADHIAEGSIRHDDLEFAESLDQAQAAASRLGSSLQIAADLGLIAEAQADEMVGAALALTAKMGAFRRFLAGEAQRNPQ